MKIEVEKSAIRLHFLRLKYRENELLPVSVLPRTKTCIAGADIAQANMPPCHEPSTIRNLRSRFLVSCHVLPQLEMEKAFVR